MRKLLRWLGYGVAGVAVLLIAAAGWIWFASSRELNRAWSAAPERLAAPTPAQIADAPRQARLLGCLSCHGPNAYGNKLVDEPGVATLWAPNLAEVASRATDAQLARAIRQGIGVDGRPLWIMPSGMFSRLTDTEVATLVAWIRTLPPGGERTPRVALGPIGRFGVASGQVPPAPASREDYRVRQPYDLDPGHAAGRRIASLICADCHAPDLTGGEESPGLSIVGAYDLDQFRTLMRTGRPPSGRDLGIMSVAARDDFSHFTDAEIGQLYGYLVERAARVQDPPREE